MNASQPQWIKLIPFTFVFLFFSHMGATPTVSAQSDSNEILRVVTFIEEPWVTQKGNLVYGFHADLWDAIAKQAGLKYEFIVVDEWAKMLAMIENGQADVAVEHHGVNADRETKMDFTHEVFGDGMQVVISKNNQPLTSVSRVLIESQALQILGIGFLILLVIAHLVWLTERSHPETEFPKSYFQGLQYAISWALLTIINQEGIVSKHKLSRLISAIWFFLILFGLSAFTAQLATAFTIGQLTGTIKSIDDLNGRTVGTWPNGKQRIYLESHNINMVLSDHSDELIKMLKNGQVEALLLDTGNAYYFTNTDPSLELAGTAIRPGSIAYPIIRDRPDLVEKINQALLTLRENGTYDLIYERYFGEPPGTN